MLHFLHSRQLGQHAGTGNRAGPLDLVPGVPGGRGGVVAWPVAGAEVDNGDLEDAGGVAGEVVEELPLGGRGDAGAGEDFGEGEAEDGDGLFGDGVLEVTLVKDVALAVLDEEDDTGLVVDEGGAVSVVGGDEAGGETFGAVVFGQVEGWVGAGVFEEGVLGLG